MPPSHSFSLFLSNVRSAGHCETKGTKTGRGASPWENLFTPWGVPFQLVIKHAELLDSASKRGDSGHAGSLDLTRC